MSIKEEDVFTRYSRQIFMEEVSIDGQRRLMKSKVLLVGAGGLGSAVIPYLAAAGIGELGIIDQDILEIHNLNRQIIHREDHIGKPKVQSAAKFVQGLNRHVKLKTWQLRLDHTLAEELFPDYDIIVDCTDNFESRYVINDACVAFGKPLVYGSIQGFEGQMSVFNMNGGKNLRDLFQQPSDSSQLPSCDSLGVLGPLAGLIGNMMALEVLKIVIGLPMEINQLCLINGLNWDMHRISY